ncbi:MAG: 50S ribosomal protein L18 [Deltaproteobacteria bacterium CG2_30_63_29]|nr:MAG: 50S ribosomal protein L18 [Deltaproteobacteria bacterium CG2_30_63_29]PIV99953.1 MAG: 50S ribosomal protein L18 [Deltaproteobacteria bacterium CG17_big_fil_post_rev_8_21_14_2_50_63_7]PJB35136.1 MAG: 50S ribosomal protein L18 [Deltaproteobacteria bacterium CG_4_9_14_3_um_filter_63_12]
MAKTSNKVLARLRRQKSIRKRLVGTTERPRLSIFRSTKHIYTQVIDDSTGTTLAAVSSLSAGLELSGKTKKDQAKVVGEAVAKMCLERNITKVAFDRNGFIYHGRVAAVAEGARSGGLEF